MKKKISIVVCLALLGALVTIWLMPAPDAKRGPDSAPIRIGSILSLSGPAAHIGVELQEGQRLGARYWGETKNIPVTLEWQDSKASPKDALAAFAVMRAKGFNLFTANLSGVSLALKSEIESAGSVLLAMGAHPSISNPPAMGVFLFSQTAAQEAVAISEQASRGTNGPFLIFYSGDDYGQAFFKACVDRLGESKNTVQGVQFKPEDSSVLRTMVQQALANKPARVIVAGAGSPMTLVFQHIRESGYQGNIYANIGFALTGVMQKLGADAGKVSYTVLDIPATSDAAKWAATTYANEKKRSITPEALIGFYSIYVLAKAAKEGDSPQTISEQISIISARELSEASVSPNEIAFPVRLVIQ